jgi:hypothetical protein
MKKEEHKALLEKLQKATTDAEKMECILELDKDYTGVLQERDTAVKERDTATAEKNKFAELNTKLWLENSAQTEEEKKHLNTDGQETGGTNDEPPQKATFGDLESKFEAEYKEE